MQHFRTLDPAEQERLFFLAPEHFDAGSDPLLLAVGLGATLYSPANRADLAKGVLKQTAAGCLSTVLCLEDAVPDDELDAAEDNLLAALADLDARHPDELPLLFIRCRSAEQLLRIGRRAGEHLRVVTGFVLPKFENETSRGRDFLDAVAQLNTESGRDNAGAPLRAMPIIEDPLTTHVETRLGALQNIAALIDEFQEIVLCVRLGATDMSSAFGIRRSRDLTIYDVQVVASAIGDVVNVLGRAEHARVISAPVWEHFTNSERLLKPLLRVTPFDAANEKELRQRILIDNLDGLLREIELDQANGLQGKTVIHPSHVPVVHAMLTVTHEQYVDALDVMSNAVGGVMASTYGNKMNELKPHRSWAERTLLRARAFGVARADVSFVELLEAGMR
ncbi:ATP/GTP-binding protein [Arthrobacter pityocampae]|uniref:ATP/GTP-binding protein n=1 Tax=Arthrobacter pityocampae TaxID=547334 RepID=A0A2S5ITZ4_9MICC|nr:HpcH/HpaI aldolase/citrate lyase family protein [Arthrobacter pityocampae]PPB48052.1 ATP/GTP-binding protein [Arthrobacter pityocampae]